MTIYDMTIDLDEVDDLDEIIDFDEIIEDSIDNSENRFKLYLFLKNDRDFIFGIRNEVMDSTIDVMITNMNNYIKDVVGDIDGCNETISEFANEIKRMVKFCDSEIIEGLSNHLVENTQIMDLINGIKYRYYCDFEYESEKINYNDGIVSVIEKSIFDDELMIILQKTIGEVTKDEIKRWYEYHQRRPEDIKSYRRMIIRNNIPKKTFDEIMNYKVSESNS